MKKLLIFGFLFSLVSAQHLSQNWSEGTAYVLPHGRWEVGLFQPLKVGYSPSTEITVHPLAMFVMPNASIKHVWKRQPQATWASVHSAYYPTPLLNMLAKEGTGGLVSPEFEFPAAILLYNELRVSRPINDKVLMTGKTGLGLGKAFGDLDERTTIDFPLIYQRLSPLYNGAYLRIGADFVISIAKKWELHLDDDLFLMANKDATIGFEHKGLLVWKKSDRFRATVGYKVVFGQYPFGNQWNLIPPYIPLLPIWVPLFDFQWGW